MSATTPRSLSLSLTHKCSSSETNVAPKSAKLPNPQILFSVCRLDLSILFCAQLLSTFLHFETSNSPLTHSLVSSMHSSFPISNDVFEDEDVVIGDCVVFEEGIFDEPCLQNVGDGVLVENFVNSSGRNKTMEVEPEKLIPDERRGAQAEINITKKETRKIAQELELNSRVEKKFRKCELGRV